VLRDREGEVAPSRGGRIARLILDLVYHLATPLVLLRLAVPSRCFTRRRYRAGMLQRLGAAPRRKGNRLCLWLHAVSVGELRAALPLLEGLRRACPDWDLWVSTSTDTGQELALRSLPPGMTVFYYPLDYGWAVRRTLRRVRPDAVVLLELELWPNFLLAAEEAGVPVLVASGRISDRSYPQYRRLRSLSRRLFSRVTAFAAQSEVYASRFEALGVPRERIEVLGNLKYDGSPGDDPRDPLEARLGWSSAGEGLVLMAGCTHPGEEDTLFKVWSELRRSLPRLRLILAPRHIERAGEVEGLVAAAGEPVARWSRLRQGAPPLSEPGRDPVILVDVMGDLDRFYRLADVVFVGGSLFPRGGGHNLLEPARLGKPVLYGPSVRNVEEVSRHLLTSRAAVQVKDRGGLQAEMSRLFSDPGARQALGERARAAAGALGGATERHLDWIRRKLSSRFTVSNALG
jgi:3-deoxy-D-manno-octulosonic-acid transferase